MDCKKDLAFYFKHHRKPLKHFKQKWDMIQTLLWGRFSEWSAGGDRCRPRCRAQKAVITEARARVEWCGSKLRAYRQRQGHSLETLWLAEPVFHANRFVRKVKEKSKNETVFSLESFPETFKARENR